MSTSETSEYLTIRDAARRIGVHENTVRNWVARGLLDPVKVADSRYQRFRADDIDRVAHQQQVSSEKARRTEGTSELVDADYLDSWAGSRQAEELLPEMVARLIEGTTGVVGVHMRTGDGIRLRGWDGVVEDSPGSPWVPAGPSAWELGTSGDPRRKADDEYKSRTTRPLEIEPSVTTFVFVTARRWPAARKWEQARRAEGRWHGVRVLDADDLAGWLRSQPATHLWFSEKVGLQPLEVWTLGQWWDRFRRQIEPPIPPELLLAGRDQAVRRLLSRVQSPAAPPVFIRAASRDEATAFIAAAFETSTAAPKDDALIATSPQGWERLSLASQPGVLIPHIDDAQSATAIGMGHRVIVPLAAGITTPFRGEVIELGPLDRNIARDVLVREASLGFTEADRLAGLARRSLASFLRAPELAAVPRSSPPWARGDRARLLASLVLAGSWAPTEADQRAIAQIAGRDWQSVEDELVAVSDSSDPPFVRMGAGWQVVSPDGAWALLRYAGQPPDVERFCEVAVEVLGEPDPTLVLDQEERLLAHVRGIRRPFSHTFSRGIAQGLALLGAFEDNSSGKSRRRDDAEYAKMVVRRLLQRANDDSSGLLWRSISSYLQLLAEAAPGEFLDAVEADLAGEDPVLRKMFADGKQSIAALGASSEHAGLLWALELLCWSPNDLLRAAAALARLVEIDPDGRLANRPDNSLRTVFLPWLPQTSAPLKSRLEVLDYLGDRFPAVTWKLELAILPTGQDASSPTPRPRFQQWPTTEDRPPLSEWLEAITEITKRAIKDAGRDPVRWSELVTHVADLPTSDRAQLITALGGLSPADMKEQARTTLWRALVSLIAQHRDFRDARWALDDDTLQQLEVIAENLKPDDPVGRFAPFFDWDPHLPQVPRNDYEARERAAAAARADAVRQILGHLGFPGIERLARASTLPEQVGASTADVAPGEHFPEIRSLLSRTDELRRLAHGWVRQMAADVTWLDDRIAEMSGWSVTTQSGFLLAIGIPNARIVAVIDSLDLAVQRQYWEAIRPLNVEDNALEDVVNRLLAYDRPWAAVDLLSLTCHRPNPAASRPVSTGQVVSVLNRVLASDAADPGVAIGAAFEIGQLLDFLENAEVEEATLARLEWSFFRVLERTRKPRALYRTLSAAPEFFAELVCRVYRPKNAPSSAKVDEQTIAIAQNAWSVLYAWRPRLDESGGMDSNELRSWVERVRAELRSRDRADIGDHQIGQTLSGTQLGTDGAWPTEQVRKLIEDLASTNLESGLATGVLNSRGTTSRGLYDGGAQEWALAAKYQSWTETVARRWPRTGRLLTQLAEEYERQARREDLEAHTRASGL
jgi:DNA-binding transcriptional MerR regulator